MIIVRQDRKTIVNFENIDVLGIEKQLEDNDAKFIITVDAVNANSYVLAKYDTEKRAKEVLNKIIQFCADNSKTNLTENLMLTMYDKNFGIKTDSINSVFYMPEE